MKIGSKKIILLTLLLLCTGLVQAQMPYNVFKQRYSPHNNTILDSKNDGVKTANGLSSKELAGYLDTYVVQEEKQVFMAIVSSIRREHCGMTIGYMEPAKAIRGLNWLKDEWVRELMWYTSEETYNKLAPYLTAITGWNGVMEGTTYSKVKPFGPLYAGVGYNIGFTGYRGINEFLESYDNNVPKTAPNGSSYPMDDPMGKMRWAKGFAASAGLALGKSSGLDITFSRRSTVADAVFGPFTREIKYAGNFIGLGIMKYQRKKKWDVYTSWGPTVTMGSLTTRIINDGAKADWSKVDGKYFSAGIMYRLNYQRLLTDKLPLMINISPYINMNLIKQDFNGLTTVMPGNFSGETKDLMSGVSTAGIEVGLAWNFRMKKKPQPIQENYLAKRSPYMNTIFDELNPIVSPDGRTLYFSRNNDVRNTNGVDDSQDMWRADVSGGTDSAKAVHLSTPFNQLKYNYMAGITPDENTIMISGAFVNGKMEGKGYSLTHRTRDGWSEPKKMQIEGFGELVKGAYAGAFLSNDGQHLVQYFSETTGTESYDLYVSHLKEDGTWTRPQKLGNLNTKSNEMSPFLASDGVTLYFSSDRSGGLGSNDIYVTKRLDDTWTNWSEPKNMGSDVNSDKWDAYYTIDAQGKYAYMVSYKNAGMGSDIVRIKLKEDVQPDPVVLVKGRVLNAKTKEPLEASVAYNSLNGKTQNGIARTNPATGEYKIVLPYGSEYSFLGEAKNFVAQSNNLDLNQKGQYREIEMDIYLYPIEVGSTVRLNNIFFETGKATLTEKSTAELDRLVKILNENPNVEIEIGGHTDNVGAAAFNKQLSAERAASVVTYLVSKGVNKSRLKSVGYGMDRPAGENNTEEGRAYNRRVEFTITKN